MCTWELEVAQRQTRLDRQVEVELTTWRPQQVNHDAVGEKVGWIRHTCSHKQQRLAAVLMRAETWLLQLINGKSIRDRIVIKKKRCFGMLLLHDSYKHIHSITTHTIRQAQTIDQTLEKLHNTTLADITWSITIETALTEHGLESPQCWDLRQNHRNNRQINEPDEKTSAEVKIKLVLLATRLETECVSQLHEKPKHYSDAEC